MREKEINISGISENLSDMISKEVDDAKKSNTFLSNRSVAISVSESEEIDLLGLSNHHIIDLSVELARYLFVNKAKLVYGGDLRKQGFTEIFSLLSYQYKLLKDTSPCTG